MGPRSGSRVFDHRAFGPVGSRRRNRLGCVPFVNLRENTAFEKPTRIFLHLYSGRRRMGDLQHYLDLRSDLAYDLHVVSLDVQVNPRTGDMTDTRKVRKSLGHDDSARRRGWHARRTTLFDMESGPMEPELSRAGSGTFGRSPLGVARATPTRRRVGPARKSVASRFTATSRGPLHLWGFLFYRAPRRHRSRIPVHLQTPRNETFLEVACWRSHRRV